MIQLSGNRVKTRIRNTLPVLCIFGSVLMLGGCTLPGVLPNVVPAGSSNDEAMDEAKSVSTADRIMIGNLAAVVAQLFDPFDTTLQINRQDTDARMQYLITQLAGRGFGIQRVSADQGANYLSYERTENEDDEVRLSIAIGAVTVGRDYELLRRDVVTPISRVRLSGTRVPVTIADKPSSTFRVSDSTLSQAQYVASLSLDEQSPVISLITPELVQQVTQGTSQTPSLQALNSSQIEVNNLFYGNPSTFASVLDDYQKVDRQIIVFGNDSMVLGDTNKQLIEQFVDAKLKRNDVISLVGCSNGPTALEIGNEGLALGRAKRVTEALMARGVARERVLDEGCWAPTNAGDRFPSRGVVMELWRRRT